MLPKMKLVFLVVALALQLGGACAGQCTLQGCSACGGTDRLQCQPTQRYCTQTCPGQPSRNACIYDDYCARTANTYFPNISGSWKDTNNSQFTVSQSLGELTFTGPGTFGVGHGKFVFKYQFTMTWPKAGSYTGIVENDERHIKWSNGMVWTKQ